MRGVVVDSGKAAPLIGYLTAVFSGWSVGEWAAFAALVYSLILIAEKAWRGSRWLARKVGEWRVAG